MTTDEAVAFINHGIRGRYGELCIREAMLSGNPAVQEWLAVNAEKRRLEREIEALLKNHQPAAAGVTQENQNGIPEHCPPDS